MRDRITEAQSTATNTHNVYYTSFKPSLLQCEREREREQFVERKTRGKMEAGEVVKVWEALVWKKRRCRING